MAKLWQCKFKIFKCLSEAKEWAKTENDGKILNKYIINWGHKLFNYFLFFFSTGSGGNLNASWCQLRPTFPQATVSSVPESGQGLQGGKSGRGCAENLDQLHKGKRVNANLMWAGLRSGAISCWFFFFFLLFSPAKCVNHLIMRILIGSGQHRSAARA